MAVAALLGLTGLASSASAQCSNYMIAQGTGTIVPGVDDSGNHIDDGLTDIALPFAWSIYGTAYNDVNVSSNGNMQFGVPAGTFPAAYTNDCLPSPAQITGPMICPHWDDLLTTNAGEGVFTSTSGSAPNRIFNIEWRAHFFGQTGTANFEVRLYEGLPRFDIIYGEVDPGGISATVGCQASSAGPFTQFECNTGGLNSGLMLTFDCPSSFPPTCSLSTNPTSGTAGSSFQATAQVIPGGGPTSTGITVSLDASSVGAGTVTLFDDGTHGDAVAGDNIFTNSVTVDPGAAPGSHALTSTVNDAQGRQSNCSANFSVTGPNDECSGAIPAILGNNPFDSTTATTSLPAPSCGLIGSDLWYTFSDPAGGVVTVSTCGLTTGDSAMAVYDTDCATELGCNDDFCGLESTLSFCAAPNHVYMLRIGGFDGETWVGSFNVSISPGANAPMIAAAIAPACGGDGAIVTIQAQVTDFGCPQQTVVSATADASSIGGSSTVSLNDDGIPPDAAAGDGIYSGSATVGSAAGGGYSVPVTVNFSGGPVTASAPFTVTSPYVQPSGATAEEEPCGVNNPDVFDGGCNSTPPVYNSALFCTTYTGTAANSTAFRDTDWWRFTLTGPDTITVVGQAQFPAQFLMLSGDCPTTVLAVATNPCGPDLTLTYSAPAAGDYVFFCSPLNFNGDTVCGVDDSYWFRMTQTSNPNCTPVGACCMSTGCTQLSAADCQAAGGTYNGDGTPCTNCPPVGSCCTSSGCSIITQAACTAANGTWGGAGSSCPIGAGHGYASDPNLAIPDAGPPVTDTISVPDSFNVAHMAVHVTIPDHTYISDLTVDLTHGATTVRLWNQECGSNDGLDVTFDDAGTPVVCAQPTTGTYQPSSPLSAFNGSSVNGDWILTCQDHVGGDIGTLTHWDLDLHAPGSCGPVCGSADFNCDGDIGTDQDIESFFACLAGTCPPPPCTNSADFNGDGDIGTDQDIEAFFRVLAGGHC